jgi:uncharacterized protein DUF5906/bifunctional DNA primase/polymerase-like protein
MSIHDIAHQYIDDGWSVVPLNPGEKRASVRWQAEKYVPDHFNDDSNIAIKLGNKSNGLVDVDCDHPFAVAAAKRLLPITRTFGRGADLARHYLYHCQGIRTTQFTDVKNSDGKTQMLVEVRSTGCYTMFPPSLHPSGEAVSWADANVAIMTRMADEMFADARSVALATLLAIHYPGHGARHFCVGQHLPGFFLQAGLDEILVKQIIRTAAELAGDTDWPDRESAIRATIEKFKRGDNVTGGPKLADELGPEVVSKMRAWLKCADVDALEGMNEKHFFVTLGTKSVIGREDKPKGVVFQPVKELYSEYANRMVQIGTDKDGNATFGPLFETWLKSSRRRSYSEVVFAPPPLAVSDSDYNLWKGFAIDPSAGDCSKYLAHLRDNICSGNLEHYDWVLDFMAHCVQRPGEHVGSAVVLKGKQGTGKGTALAPFEMFFGKRHYTHLSRSEELVKWNALVSAKVVVFADEAFFAGDKQNLGALKRMITEPTITIARKHLDSTEEANCLHLFMATNEDWAIPAGIGERRFLVLAVNPQVADDEAVFTPIYDELRNGGAAALLDMFLKRGITHDLRRPPKTTALRAEQDQSLPSHLKFVLECLHLGTIGHKAWEDGAWVASAQIHEAYLLWANRNHQSWPVGLIDFVRKTREYFSARKPEPRSINGERVKCVLLRDLGDARDYWDAEMRTKGDWDLAPGTSQMVLP